MSVRLVSSRRLPAAAEWDQWCSTAAPPMQLEAERRVADLPHLLDAAFQQGRADWLELAGRLATAPSARLAHMPACAANASDFGLMLAWSTLVAKWAAGPGITLVVCDDPWLYRHLAGLPGVQAGRPPNLWRPALHLALRGLAARARVSLSACMAAIALRADCLRVRPGAPALLVYAHPASAPDGEDAYFGPMMAQCPAGDRLLHVDGGVAAARRLSGPHTISLHAFGSPLRALTLWAECWQPAAKHRTGPLGWLVRRAAALEGGTGQAAMIAWQIHCQNRWLARARPTRVVWPWENHSWERAMVRRCRGSGIATLGYQHATIGRHEWNYLPAACEDALPDAIACAGRFWAEVLHGWGVPSHRLAVGGAIRFPDAGPPAFDPAGPVFVALPAMAAVAAQMVAAIRPLAARGMRFLVREHPMTPIGFVEANNLARAPGPLETSGAVRAVLFAATTVGLEAALAGLPVIRFLCSDRVANDILPPGMDIPAAGAEDIEAALATAEPREPPERNAIFSPVDWGFWRTMLA